MWSSCGRAVLLVAALFSVGSRAYAQPQLQSNPSLLTFPNCVVNGGTLQNTISITSTGTPISFQAVARAADDRPWISVSPGSATTPATLTISVDSNQLTAGPHGASIQLGYISGGPRQLNVGVNVDCKPPLTITTTSVPAGVIGTPYNFALGATGGTPPYSWGVIGGNLPPGLGLGSGGGLGGTPTSTGSFTFTVQVTDANGATNTRQFTMSVGAGAQLIVDVNTLGFTHTVGAAGPQAKTFSYASSDQTNRAITLNASVQGGGNWLSVQGSSGTTPGTATVSVNPTGLSANTYVGAVTATMTGTTPVTVSVTLVVSPAQTPPLSISAASPPAGVVGTAYNYAFAATGGTPPYTWSVASGALPGGLTLSPGGVLSGTPTTASNFAFGVRVTDSANANTTANVSVNITPAVQPLTITGAAPPSGTVGQAYNYSFTASGGTGAYTWSIASGAPPAGLGLSSGGVLSGTPTAGGTSAFQVRVTDSGNNTTTAAVSVTINPQTPPLAISTVAPPNGTIGQAYSYAFGATGGSPPYTWQIASGAPPPGTGLSSGGVLSGTPTTEGTFGFSVRVTDSAGASTTASVSITISPQVTQLSITSGPPPSGVVGTAYNFSFSAAGGSVPYSWSVSAGATPPGINLAPTGAMTGTPTTAGPFAFTVLVTDAQNRTASTQVVVNVTQTGPQLSIETRIPPAGTIGTAYSFTFGAGGGSPPYTWSITTGSAPPGLTLSAAGALTGTPTTAGNFPFTVRVTDSANATASSSVSITVSATQPLPVITSVENGASFSPSIAPGMWLTIRGTNLAPGERTNTPGEMVNGVRPTSMDGVSVRINNKPAFFYYISPTQLNVVAPDDDVTGPVAVTVTVNGRTSAGFTAQLQPVAPAFFLWPGNQAVATSHPDYLYRVKPGTFPSLQTVGARPGEVLILWGTGFGPTVPALPAGQVATGLHQVSGVRVTVGGREAQVIYTALATGFTSLFQVAIIVPDVADGDWPVVATVGGNSSPVTALLTVQR